MEQNDRMCRACGYVYAKWRTHCPDCGTKPAAHPSTAPGKDQP